MDIKMIFYVDNFKWLSLYPTFHCWIYAFKDKDSFFISYCIWILNISSKLMFDVLLKFVSYKIWFIKTCNGSAMEQLEDWMGKLM
jgi:hypothetical protein